MGIEDLDFVQGFCRLCNDGWLKGWHERNGGNLTYRLTIEDVAAARSEFGKPGKWVPMWVQANSMRNAFFLTTGAGKYMRNITEDPAHNIGIVEINRVGDSYRIVWGLLDEAKPTSEFPTHFLNHAVTAKRTNGKNRVIYHTHTPSIIAMSSVVPLTDRDFSRRMWKMMTELILHLPQGVGVVPWMVPGGPEIAAVSSELMKVYDAIVWAHHGLFTTGPDFDRTFGLTDSVEKAAYLYLLARSASGGSDRFLNGISDQNLRDTCRMFGVTPNENFLY